jgi:UDP-glucose 4-epimerase
MKAFVTGGTGMVGSVFLPKLLAAGWEVTALARDPAKPGLLRHERLVYHPGDVANPESMQQLLAAPPRCDVVFHLAASLDYFGPLPKLLAVNAEGTTALARFACAAGAKRFVYASSIEAAGSFTAREIPAQPGQNGRPLTSYGISKRAAEKIVLELSAQGVAPICLRIGNVYGPGWFNFIVEFARSILTRGRQWAFLPLYANRYLSPVWNDDVADGLLAAAAASHSGIENLVGPAATVEEMFRLCADTMSVPFVLARRRPADWLQICYYSRWLTKLTHQGGECSYLTTPVWPHLHRAFGMEASARRLGCRVPMPLREGIRQTLAWARTAGHVLY